MVQLRPALNLGHFRKKTFLRTGLWEKLLFKLRTAGQEGARTECRVSTVVGREASLPPLAMSLPLSPTFLAKNKLAKPLGENPATGQRDSHPTLILGLPPSTAGLTGCVAGGPPLANSCGPGNMSP